MSSPPRRAGSAGPSTSARNPGREKSERGHAAETLVIQGLDLRGWRVLCRNLRVGRLELDVVAEHGGVLHVIEVQDIPAQRRGALDHMAFFGGDIVVTLSLLKQHRTTYRLQRLPRPWSTWQVFFQDPNGAEVEIDFDAAQTVPPELRDGRPAP